MTKSVFEFIADAQHVVFTVPSILYFLTATNV